jgi:hypothetical protein
VRFSSKSLFAVVVIFLSTCGGDIHEAKNSVRISDTRDVSSTIQERISSATRFIPKTTTTTTVDPEVLKFNLVVWKNELLRQKAEKDAQIASDVHISTEIHQSSSHSDAWWQAVSICEQGGRNDSYFGYFSLMDGSAGGGKSWATQVQMANAIIARAGDHAWASKCVNAGYQVAPNG